MVWADHPTSIFVSGIILATSACAGIGITKGILINNSLEKEVVELSKKLEESTDIIKNRDAQITDQNKLIRDKSAQIQAYQQNYPNFRKEVDDFKLDLDKKKQTMDYYLKNCSIKSQIKDLELQRIEAKNSSNMRQNMADVFGNGNSQGSNDLEVIDNRVIELTKKLNCESTLN